MKIDIICLMILLTIWSCQNNIEEQNSIPKITLTKNINESVVFEDLMAIDSIKTINTKNYSAFGSIQKVFEIDNKLLLDTSMPKTLTLLNNNLSVIKQIVPDFDNPNNLNQITSVCVFGDEIYVLEREKFNISVLNHSLEIIEKIKIPVFCQSFQVLGNSKLALYTGNEPTENNKGKFVIFDYFKNLVINDLLPVSNVQREYFNFLTAYHFDESFDGYLFWDSSINKIFKLTSNGLIDLYDLDYGKEGVPKNFYEETSFENPFDFISQMRNTDYAFRHFKITSNDEKILITYEKRGNLYHCLYDIGSQKNITFNSLTSKHLAKDKIAKNETGFFVSLYGKNKAICFFPFEFAENQSKQTIDNIPAYQDAVNNKENILLFCTLQ